LVRDLLPGSASADPGAFRIALGRLFFAVDDGVHGHEPWYIEAGSAGSRPALLRNLDCTAVDPPAPPLASLLPLDPVRDLYLAPFRPGDVDPDPFVFEG